VILWAAENVKPKHVTTRDVLGSLFLMTGKKKKKENVKPTYVTTRDVLGSLFLMIGIQ
jgi:hypothetical protein